MLRGRFHEKVLQPSLWIQFADGSVEARELASTEGTFEETVTLPAAGGQMVFEISGQVGGIDRLLATAPVGVGEAPAAWPANADVEAKNALELVRNIGTMLASVTSFLPITRIPSVMTSEYFVQSPFASEGISTMSNLTPVSAV